MTTHISAKQTSAPSAPTVSPALPETFSLVLGICSLLMGWTFFVPLAGFICGIYGVRKDRGAKKLAVWGIVLNMLALAGWLILVAAIGFTVFYSTYFTIPSKS